MLKVPKLCFVTNELYPINKGGIGRFIYNMILNKWDKNVEFYLLLYGENFHNATEQDKKEVSDTYKGKANIYYAQDLIISGELKVHTYEPDPFDSLYNESYLLYKALEELQSKKVGAFDYIEFLDFKGSAAVTINAKKLGQSASHAQIGVRLHSTNSIICANENFETPYTDWHNAVHDIERLALESADYVVSHLDAISKYNKNFYNFGGEWLKRVHINFPPVILDEEIENVVIAKDAKQVDPRPKFVFSSRIAPFKRPDIFVDAAIILLSAGYDADFIIMSYGWDQLYVDKIKSRIPNRFSQHLYIEDNYDEVERLKALADAIIVIPSLYESFCFFAYESLQRGNKLILNAECIAFRDSDFWQNNKNCLMFDGSPVDLAIQMQSAVKWQFENNDISRPGEPYWELEGKENRSNLPSDTIPDNKKSITILHKAMSNVDHLFIDAHDLPEEYRCEIVSLNDGMRSSSADLYWHDDYSIKKYLSDECENEYIMVLTGKLTPDEGYVKSGIDFLNANPEYAAVYPQCKNHSGNAPYGFFGGNLVSLSISKPTKVLPYGAIIRRSEFVQAFNKKGLREYWYPYALINIILTNNKIIGNIDSGIDIVGNEIPFYALNDREMSEFKMIFIQKYLDKYHSPVLHQSISVVQPMSNEATRDLNRQLNEATSMSRERYSAIVEMEQMIIARDNEIKRLKSLYFKVHKWPLYFGKLTKKILTKSK